MARHEQERHASFTKRHGNPLDALAPHVDIQHSEIAILAIEQTERVLDRASASHDREAGPGQRGPHLEREKRLVLDDQYASRHWAPSGALSNTAAAGALISQLTPAGSPRRDTLASSAYSTMLTMTVYPKP